MIVIKQEDRYTELAGIGTKKLIEAVYPIGSIYLSVSNVNPRELFGMGEWVPFAQNRTLIGVGTEYLESEELGGSSAINLSHSHTVPSHYHSTANHTLTIDEIPSHKHSIYNGHLSNVPGGSGITVANYNIYGDGSGVVTNNTGGSRPHNHGNTGTKSAQTTSSNLSTINILNPYVTVYMFKRVA